MILVFFLESNTKIQVMIEVEKLGEIFLGIVLHFCAVSHWLNCSDSLGLIAS